MKTNFSDIKGMLTRDQMKQIKGGSGTGGGGCTSTNDNPTRHCSPSGCGYQCWVTCTDTCGQQSGCLSPYVC